MSAKPYNGHHCWNCWNVSLWIGNDEGLYRLALECIDSRDRNGKPRNLDGATRAFLRNMDGKTPDGAKYTVSGVRRALSGLSE